MLMCKDQVEPKLPATIQDFANVFGHEVLKFIYKQKVRIPLGLLYLPGKSAGEQFINEKRTEKMLIIRGDGVLPSEVDEYYFAICENLVEINRLCLLANDGANHVMLDKRPNSVQA